MSCEIERGQRTTPAFFFFHRRPALSPRGPLLSPSPELLTEYFVQWRQEGAITARSRCQPGPRGVGGGEDEGRSPFGRRRVAGGGDGQRGEVWSAAQRGGSEAGGSRL